MRGRKSCRDRRPHPVRTPPARHRARPPHRRRRRNSDRTVTRGPSSPEDRAAGRVRASPDGRRPGPDFRHRTDPRAPAQHPRAQRPAEPRGPGPEQRDELRGRRRARLDHRDLRPRARAARARARPRSACGATSSAPSATGSPPSIHAGTFRLSLRREAVLGQNLLAAAVLTAGLSVGWRWWRRWWRSALGIEGTVGVLDLAVISIVGGALASIVVMAATLLLTAGAVRAGLGPRQRDRADRQRARRRAHAAGALAGGRPRRHPPASPTASASCCRWRRSRSWWSPPAAGSTELRRIVRESLPILFAAATRQHARRHRAREAVRAVRPVPGAAGAGARPPEQRRRARRHPVRTGVHQAAARYRGADRLARAVGPERHLVRRRARPPGVRLQRPRRAPHRHDPRRRRARALGSLLAVSLIGGAAAVVFVAAIAYAGAVVSVRTGVDPDTYGIPVVSSTLDLVGCLHPHPHDHRARDRLVVRESSQGG